MLQAVLLHTLAVAVALGVALVLVNLLGVDSPVVAAVLALILVALEKLVRFSQGDWVNKK